MGRMLASLARLSREHRKVRAYSRDPVGAQERVLRGLLRRAAGTEWGRRHDFARLAREPALFQAYRDAVPLRLPEDFREDIERMSAGESDVAWPGRLSRFVMSSGTLSGRKVLPLSEETLDADVAFGRRVFLSYLAATGRAAPLGGVPLSLPGATLPHPSRADARCGEISGLVAEHLDARGGPLARRIRDRRVLPESIRRLEGWDAKLDAVADWGLARDVRTLVGAPSWLLAILDRVLERSRRSGDHVDTVSELWPRLHLVISGGLPVEGYREALQQRIGGEVDVIDTYGASEGFLGFQTDPADPSLLLDLDGSVFFEFVRVDELGTASPRRFTVEDVELDVPHAVYLSTASGLWAYALGDIVRFRSRVPARILFAGRTAEVLNSWREEVSAEMARSALIEVCRAFGASQSHFHVAPRFAGGGRRHGHQWVVEFLEPPPDLPSFRTALDEAMRRQAPNYETFRRLGEFEPLELVAVAPGTCARWLQLTRGDVSVQSKVACLSEGREIAEGLIAAASGREVGAPAAQGPPAGA